MYHRMRPKIILPALAFVLAIVLSGYVYLSVSVGRALKASEFARFSDIILESSILHRSEGGGSKALGLSKAALSSAPSNGMIALAGRSYVFPLPKYAVPQGEGEGGQYFLAFVSPEEMQDYFYRELPKAGWKHVDQMGAGHFFESDDASMTITQHFYLTSGISEFTVSIRERR